MTIIIPKKVIISLSGGVDSSVAAFLLQKQNFLVEAIFMRNWDSSINFDILGNPEIKQTTCPQEKDYKDAIAVAKKLNIKLHKVNFIEEYWNKVFLYFLKNIKKNLTPNPDILCNNEIKFKLLINYINKKFNPDFIATGHYAKIENKNHQTILKKASDQNKDQTYFLSQLKTKQLKKILFPLGELTKTEVRKIALQANLITAHKKDSTGICFIGERKFTNFLENYLPIKSGPMKKLDGTLLKQHKGTIFYTIGQRKGLGLGNDKNNASPWFVVGKNLKTNTLYVEQDKNHFYLYSDSALIVNIIWRLSIKEIQKKITEYRQTLKVKFRYRQKEKQITIEWIDNKTAQVCYPYKIKSVTPGQICAFYIEDICLGAGQIQQVYLKNQKLIYS